MQRAKATRPVKAKPPEPPTEPTNKYGHKERVGKPKFKTTKTVTEVGLGGLEVITAKGTN